MTEWETPLENDVWLRVQSAFLCIAQVAMIGWMVWSLT